MRWTKSLIPTLKEDPQDAEVISHKLMIRAGLMRKLSSGAYSYLPLGFKMLTKVKTIIREEMQAAGAEEVLLPALQPLELWKKTGRDENLGEVMFKFRDRHGKIICLGPTHEEVITDLVSKEVSSYRDLPKILFQIQTKFRDELRPRFGVLRSCEFIMKDAYSFDATTKDADISYDKMFKAYKRIFSRCGLDYITVEADSGVMGGGVSHEFMVPSEKGEDLIITCASCGYAASRDMFRDDAPKTGDPCPKCGRKIKLHNAIEIGHTFKLGTKYSKTLGARFLANDRTEHDIIMGCYGIGVNRIIASMIETSNDKDGIICPPSIAPYEVVIMPLNMANAQVTKAAEKIYEDLRKSGLDILIDDREVSAGIKFKDSDLIGFPLQVIIGEKNLKDGKGEVKVRKTQKSHKADLKDIPDQTKSLLEKTKSQKT
ncbi:MAG: proline--tRNA ligase [Candidatus Omnitrophica bacterium]|nr:proline--tRNA ligase [Candidatus Omnitrophota bacterium]